jgi:hypothetical protein
MRSGPSHRLYEIGFAYYKIEICLQGFEAPYRLRMLMSDSSSRYTLLLPNPDPITISDLSSFQIPGPHPML